MLCARRNARKARAHLETAVQLDPGNREFRNELFEFYVDSPEWFDGGLDRATDTDVRILDGAAEIARHHRSYDRQQSILDPAHEQALLRTKRKTLHQTRAGRLALAVPESEALLERAFAEGESAAGQTAQLLRLLDQYGVAALCRAVREALERNTPRASSVAFLLRRQNRSTPLPALDLSRHPEAQALDVRPHDLETYHELAHPRDDDSEQ